MHVRGKKIRHLASILGSVAGAAVLATTLTTASATTSTAFALRGSTAGGIKTVQADQTLTFVFTEINHTAVAVPEDLVITKVTNANIVGNPPCVLPGGVAINTDSNTCEPGFVKPGQHASIVITTHVTGATGTAALVRVCLSNENTGATGPCKTVSAKIA